MECTDTGELSHECVDLAQFYHDKDIAAIELYSEIARCSPLVRSEILLKTSLELLTFIIQGSYYFAEFIFPDFSLTFPDKMNNFP